MTNPVHRTATQTPDISNLIYIQDICLRAKNKAHVRRKLATDKLDYKGGHGVSNKHYYKTELSLKQHLTMSKCAIKRCLFLIFATEH